MNAQLFTLIGGATALSVLHAAIPNHWLPFVILGRTERWTRAQTLLATFIGASAHLASTVIIGVLIGVLGMRFIEHYETHFIIIASTIMVILGVVIVFRHWRGKDPHLRPHPQAHFHPHESRGDSLQESLAEPENGPGTNDSSTATASNEVIKRRSMLMLGSLVLVLFFSPCLELEAYYLIAARMGWHGIILVSVLYYLVTVGLMVVLVAVAQGKAESLKWKALERNEGFIGGALLILLGILWLLFPL